MNLRVMPAVLLAIGCGAKAVQSGMCADGYHPDGAGACALDDGGGADTSGGGDPSPDGDSGGEDDTGDTDPGDTGTEGGALPANCDPPEARPDDPIAEIGEMDSLPTGTEPPELLIELVEVVIDVDNDTVLGVGQGGLLLYDVSTPEAPTLAGIYPDFGHGRYHRLHVFDADDPGAGLVYLTHRDHGLTVVDATDPSNIERLRIWGRPGLGGMAQLGDYLYATVHDGSLIVFDISDRVEFVERTTVEGLGNPWTVLATPSALYVADGSAGLVTMDTTDPERPEVVHTLDLGGVQDLALGDGVLYAAAGSNGIIVLDLASPLNPVEIARIEPGTSVQGVAVDGNALWYVDQERVAVVDISNPAVPVPVASRVTPQWAMDVAAKGGIAWVGDWGRLGGYSVDLSLSAPDLGLAVSELLIDSAGDSVDLALRNRGTRDLHLTGADIGGDGFTLEASRVAIPPGETGTLTVRFEGGEADTTLCIASDDPDQPVAEVSLYTSGGGTVEAVGLPAPDFALTDLDGETHRLSEHLGVPVVLVYFATW
jgi:hypothetical protein